MFQFPGGALSWTSVVGVNAAIKSFTHNILCWLIPTHSFQPKLLTGSWSGIASHLISNLFWIIRSRSCSPRLHLLDCRIFRSHYSSFHLFWFFKMWPAPYLIVTLPQTPFQNATWCLHKDIYTFHLPCYEGHWALNFELCQW